MVRLSPVRSFIKITSEEGILPALSSTKSYLLWKLPIPNDGSSFKTLAYDVIEEHIQDDSPVIVVGGAHKGGSTQFFLNAFESPTIYAVEPIPDLVQTIEDNFGNNSNVIIHQVALGPNHDEIEFNIHPHSSSSSVLKMSGAFLNSGWPDEAERFTAEKTIEVKQVPLDSISTEPDIIRLDLQGYELPALHGAEKALKNAKAVIVEISFIPHYEGQNLFLDLHQYLSNNDFQLYNFDSQSWFENQISHGMAVYFSEEVYESDSFPVNPFRYR